MDAWVHGCMDECVDARFIITWVDVQRGHKENANDFEFKAMMESRLDPSLTSRVVLVGPICFFLLMFARVFISDKGFMVQHII